MDDPWKPPANACSGMTLDELIMEVLRQNRERQEDLQREFREEWKRRNGKDHERWRPLPGDSIEVRFTGAHYGVDAAGKKWRLPEARDILNGSRDDKDAWFRVARVEDLLAKKQKKHLTKKRLKRPHRRTGTNPTGRPARMRFLVEPIPTPVTRWDLPADEGRRDFTIYRYIRELHASGVPEGEALEKALILARKCHPPFDEREVHQKVRRAYCPDRGSGEPALLARRITQQVGSHAIRVRFREAQLTEADAASIPHLAEWILRAIDGRSDRYAYYYANRDGEWHPKPTRRALLTPAVVEKHILGSSKGVYLVHRDGTASTVVFDVDAHCRSKADALSEVRRICVALVTEGAEFDRSFLVEDSGRGYHIWVFIHPAPASDSGIWGTKLLHTLNLKPDPKLRSVIPPATGGIGPKALGPLIRLPLGIHPKTGSRSRFLSSEELTGGRR